MVSSFTIGGYPCRMEQPLAWTQYSGADARIYPYTMNKDDAEALLAITKPVKIEMTGANGKKATFKNVYVVGEGAAASPFHRIVKVADSRWFWPKNHIRAQYNVPRVNTDRRVVSPPGVPVEVEQIVADVAFAKLSLKRPPGASLRVAGKKWTAREVLEDVLDRVAGKGNWKIRAKKFPQGLVQGFLIDDPGNAAITKALSLCPGLTCFQDKEGMIIIDSLIPGAADKLIESLGDPLVSGQVINRVDQSNSRAEKYSTLTTRELGMRFDFVEGDTVTDDDPYLINMAQTTLARTTINGKVVPMNTWVRLEDLLPAMQSYFLSLATAANSGLTALAETLQKFPLNIANIRKFFPSRLDIVYVHGKNPDGTDYEPMARFISGIKRHFRKTFLVNPIFSDGAIRFIAKNPGYVDAETGTEQAPPIYLDYAVQPTSLGFANDPKAKFLLYNVDNAVAAHWQSGRLSQANVSPAAFNMISDQLGLFSISLRLDLIGERHQVFPGKITGPAATGSNDDLPSGDYRNPVTSLDQASLKTGHQMNTIFCIVAGYPNDDSSLHRKTVSAFEVEKKWGITIGATRPGLEFEQRIREGLTTAQFPYDESKHEEIKKALGVVPGEPKLGDPINVDVIKDLTLASALAYYLGKLDHYAGTMTVPLRDDLEPYGEIIEVQNTLMPSGALNSIVTCQLWDFEAFDPMALLSQSSRRVLQRAVNPAGA